LSDKEIPDEDDAWVSIVDKKPLGSHRQHWFDRERSVSPTAVFSHVRLRIFPGEPNPSHRSYVSADAKTAV